MSGDLGLKTGENTSQKSGGRSKQAAKKKKYKKLSSLEKRIRRSWKDRPEAQSLVSGKCRLIWRCVIMDLSFFHLYFMQGKSNFALHLHTAL